MVVKRLENIWLCEDNGACSGVFGLAIENLEDFNCKFFLGNAIFSLEGIVSYYGNSVVAFLRLLPTH